jgi:DNA-binding CsgD family transcriptional regulator
MLVRMTPKLDVAAATFAEIVLGSSSPGAAWLAVMSELQRTIGFDSGFVAATTGAVAKGRGAILGHDEADLRLHLAPYLEQIRPDEIRLYADRARPDDEVWSTRRRIELAARYQPLHPRRARHMLVRVSWRSEALLGFNLERARRPFGPRELRIVDAVAPICHLIGSAVAGGDDLKAPRAWADAWGLTRRESDVAAMVLRGLQNAEVASALGVSPNTVRNTLARVFLKADASTRAELVFLASGCGEGADRRPTARRSGPHDGLIRFVERVRRARPAAARVREQPHDGERALITYAAPLTSA